MDIKDLISVFIFLMGSVFSLVIIPFVEKRKLEFQASQGLKKIYIELEDLQENLKIHIESFFIFLYEIRLNSKEGASVELPIPIPKNIDTSILIDIYKYSATKLNRQQRQVIKNIPHQIELIMRNAQESVVKAQQKEYCIQSLKNTIKLSCHLLYLVNGVLDKKDFLKIGDGISSNASVKPVLKSIGFSDEKIIVSRVEETRFSKTS